MTNKLLIAFLCITFFATSCGNKKGENTVPGNSDEIELKLNLTKGNKYNVKLVMNSNVEMNMLGQPINTTNSTEMGMDYEVIDILPSGNFIVRYTYKTAKLSGEAMGMKYEYDSETDTATGMKGEQMQSTMKALIGEYAEMEIDKLGKVVKTTMSKKLNDEKNKNAFENMNFSVFPDKKIKVGDTWDSNIEQNVEGTGLIVKTTYKLLSVKDGIADISMDGKIEIKPGSEGKISGTQKGSSKIEINTGIAKESIIDQEMELEINNMGMKMPMKMKNKITLTVN